MGTAGTFAGLNYWESVTKWEGLLGTGTRILADQAEKRLTSRKLVQENPGGP